MKKFINWILKFWGYQLAPIPKNLSAIEVMALEFVTQLNEAKFKDTSGEWKRAQVLRMLLNHFPNEKESDLNWTIENVLRR